jgi:GTP:adenosylcobinamide-phosphate guanylyltransferase
MDQPKPIQDVKEMVSSLQTDIKIIKKDIKFIKQKIVEAEQKDKIDNSYWGSIFSFNGK